MIEASRLLYSKLSDLNLNVTGIFPSVAEENTNLSYIVYEVENNVITTKDGICGNNAIATIYVYTESYAEGINLKTSIVDNLNLNQIFSFENTNVRLFAIPLNTEYINTAFESKITVQIRLN